MDMRFDTWNVRSIYRAGSLRVVAEDISKYKIDRVGLQMVRWDGVGIEPADEYYICSTMERSMKIVNKVQVFRT
jgi:hypothetical protein